MFISKMGLFYPLKQLCPPLAGNFQTTEILNIFGDDMWLNFYCFYDLRISGSPGKVVGELPECSQDIMTEFTKSYYQHFTPVRE